MNIKLFLEICKEFFDLMHSPFIDYKYKEKKKEIFDEENGFMSYKKLLEK